MSNFRPEFDLDNDDAYQQWKEQKLTNYPTGLGDLVVEIGNPRKLSDAEKDAMMQRIRKTNMAIYAGNTGDDPDTEIPRLMGLQFGLAALDHNTGADDGITSLTVMSDEWHKHYIPYTNRQIHWHTDGYYNPLDQQIHGLYLHCVHPAAEGGENALLDHEIAYILLRDRDPALVEAFMQPDSMTIPKNEDEAVNRPDSPGPVFMPGAGGTLHMRYTARQRNVVWKDDDATRAALDALNEIVHSDSPYIFRGTLQSGMGLMSNNVLHDRSGFNDKEGAPARLLYRLRYFDRIAGTL